MDDEPTAKHMAEMVLKEFDGDDRPATVEMVARLYSTLFVQQEAMIDLFAFMAKIHPELVFSDPVVDLRNSILTSNKMLADSLIELKGENDE